MPRQLRQEIAERAVTRVHDLLVLIDAEMPGYRACVFELVVRVLVEPHRRRHDPSRARLGHGGNDRTGVDAAGEERAKRDVADQAKADRLGEKLVEPVEVLRLTRGIAVTGELQIPVAAN